MSRIKAKREDKEMVLKMIVIAYAQSHADRYQCFKSVKGNDKEDEKEIQWRQWQHLANDR